MAKACEGQHQECAACFKKKLKTIQFQGMAAAHNRDKDSSLSLDAMAYKAFRDEGLQPQHVGGSYELMQQAETKVEVEKHTVLSPAMRKQYGKALNEAHDAGRI